MRLFQTAVCRTSQAIISIKKKLCPAAGQLVEEGEDALSATAELLKKKKVKKALIVCPPGYGETVNAVQEGLKAAGLASVVWDQIPPEPTADHAENLRLYWLGEGCDGFVAIGPGPVLDVVKLAAARAAKPGKSALELLQKGRVSGRTKPVLAIPTLEGGCAVSLSEATVRDGAGRPYTLTGRGLTPGAAVLEPALSENAAVPALVQVGMTALCRAVESYVCPLYANDTSKDQAARATGMLLRSLEPAQNGDVMARLEVLRAYRLAGLAASRTAGGYVGAMARAAYRVHGVPEGSACAVILPAVLEDYGAKAKDALAKLAAASCVMTDGDDERKSQALLWQIKNLAFRLGLPEFLEEIRRDDVPEIAELTIRQVNPRLSAPAVWTAGHCTAVLEKIMT